MNPTLERRIPQAPASLGAGLLVLLVASLLRLARLGYEGLWCDEGFTALTVVKPVARMLPDLARDDAPPFFYLLAKIVTAIGGDSEIALRLIPALAGIAAVAALLVMARRRRSPALFWAAAFFAISPYAVFYARQARDYGLLLLLAVGFVVSSRDALLTLRRGAITRLIILGALLPLTHHVGVLLVLASILVWPLSGRSRPSFLRWLLWHVIALVPWGIWWLVFGSQQLQAHAEMNAWIGSFWSRHTLGLGPFLSLGVFVPGVIPGLPLQVAIASLSFRSTIWQLGGWLSAAAVVACLVIAVRHARKPVEGKPAGRDSATERGRKTAIEWFFLIVPLALLLLVSLMRAPTYIIGRTDALAFPAFALLIGRALATRRRWLATSFIALWTLVGLASLAGTYGFGVPGETKGADREAARGLVRAGLGANDVLVHGILTSPSLEYYLHRFGVAHRVAWFPQLAAAYPAAVIPVAIDSLASYTEQARALRERFEREIGAAGTVWIVAREDVAREDVAAASDRNPAPTSVRALTANDLSYPMNVLVYHLVGMRAEQPVLRYHQDWISATQAVLRLPRASWVDVNSLPPIGSSAGAAAP